MAKKNIARNILAVIAGVIVGSLVNMLIVQYGPMVVPLPEGADVSSMENLKESMKLFTPLNFFVPWLAHALGTLVGAFIAAKFAASHPVRFGLGIGVFFLLGGIAAVRMLGGPTGFIVADLVLAYVPMGFLGAWLAGRTGKGTADQATGEIS